MANTIQMRRGTAANATTNNVVLAAGEWGYETDTGKVKIGDGTTAWNDLPYFESGGAGVLEYQAEITAASTTFNGTQKGLNKVYVFNSASAQTITINADDYAANDVINIERRGAGTVEIVQGTGVRIRGVRNIDNRYFLNDPNSMVALLCRGGNEFTIIGNLTRGYTGAVTTSLYSPSFSPTETRDITVTGTGFSSNMVVSITGNATLNSVTVNSSTQCVLNITSTGVNGDFLTITYDNGDVFVDTNAIELVTVEYLDTNYAFDSGYGLFKMSATETYFATIRRSSDDAETNVGFDDGKLTLNSPVLAGGTLTAWAGSDNVFVKVLFDQGTLGFNLQQLTNASQPRLLNAGALEIHAGKPFLYFDGVDDFLEATSPFEWGNGAAATIAGITRATPNAAQNLVNDRPDSGFHSFAMHQNNAVFFNGGNVSLTSATTLGNVYQKFAVTIKGTSSNLWVDGVSVASGAGSSSFATNNPIRMGRFATGHFEGYINHFVIWKANQTANRTSIETVINNFV